MEILPDLTAITKDYHINIDGDLSIYDNWNNSIDTLKLCNYLTEANIEAYKDWLRFNEIKKVKDQLKKKKTPNKISIKCDTTYDPATNLRRKIIYETENHLKISEYNSNDKLIFTGNYLSIYPEVKDGQFIFYYLTGNKSAEGFYNRNIPSGTWKFYDTTGNVKSIPDYDNLFKKISNDKIGDIKAFKYEEVDQPPIFKYSNFKNFENYIQSNFWFPPYLNIKKAYLSCSVQFLMDEEGKLRQAKIITGDNIEINTETLRVLYDSPVWQPAQNDGKKVSVFITLPLLF